MIRRAAAIGLVASWAVGCGSARFGSSDTGAPTLTLPVRFAERDDPDGGGAHRGAARGPSPGGSAAPPPGVPPGRSDATGASATSAPPPDPVALATRSQWELTLHYAHGAVRVDRVRPVRLERPLTTARRFGRFAVELWIGRELIERVRFEFPLLGGEPPPAGARHPLHESARFAPGADTIQNVLVPGSDRATSARIVDRATGQSWPVPWPPTEAGVSDAGIPPS